MSIRQIEADNPVIGLGATALRQSQALAGMVPVIYRDVNAPAGEVPAAVGGLSCLCVPGAR